MRLKQNERFGSEDLDEGGMLADLVLEDMESSIAFVTENQVVVAVQCPLWHCSATFQKTKRHAIMLISTFAHAHLHKTHNKCNSIIVCLLIT